MKLTLTTLIAALLSTAAVAGPFGLPDHEADGYRDTGCDPAFQTVIETDSGEYAYSNNPTCPGAPDGGKAFVMPTDEDGGEDDGDEPIEEAAEK